MDWSALPILLAISRSDSLSAAARSLGVNQTTVSRRLDALEEAMGCRLVERSTSRLSLTEAGEVAVLMSEQMETIAIDLKRQLLGGDARLSGTLVVTTTDTLALYEPLLFSSFSEKYPEVNLELKTGYHHSSIQRREADVALRWTNEPDETLFGRKMVRAHYALYGEKNLIKKIGRRAPLQQFPWLAWSPDSGPRITERWMRANVPEARVVAFYDSAVAMHAAIASGAGIAYMPIAFGDAWDELIRISDIEESFGYDIWCLTHPDLASTARVRAFLSHAAEYFKSHQQRFSGKTKSPISSCP